MPRTSRALVSQVLAQPTGFVAAAINQSGTPALNKRAKAVKREGWQLAAWEWFDTIGEYRYSVNWVGNVLSKAHLMVTKDGKETQDQNALDAMASLFGGAEGQSEMLRMLGIQFTVAGEAYIVGESGGMGMEDEWFVVAATEIKRVGGGEWKMEGRDFTDPLVVRLWRPHPRKYAESDAPSRAILPILAEIDGLTKHVAAQIDSRLAGAGLLLLPSEITFGAGPVSNDGALTQSPSADAFLQTLMDTMTTAIANREDASALVPIILQASGEHLDKIKHLSFWSGLDEKAIELRAEAIRRLALGMDMPPEILTGTADLNHWGSWQVEEASIKAHTEPLLAVITGSLTDGYLRPVLESMGLSFEEARSYAITADTSKMRLRPNRSAEAIELYDRGELDGDTLRRENGFEVENAMDDKERILWLAKKVAGGSTTPELVEAALRMLGVNLPVIVAAEVEPAEPIEPPATEARPIPSLMDHPKRQPPDTLPDAAAAAAEVMVFRALERVGNRLKNKMGTKPPGVAAADIYQFVDVDAKSLDSLLEDAWTCVGRFDLAIPADELSACLDSYVRALIVERKPHSRALLRSYLGLTQPAA